MHQHAAVVRRQAQASRVLRLARRPRPKNEKKAVPDSWPGEARCVWVRVPQYAGGIKDDTCCVGYSARVGEGGQVAAYSL